MQAGFDEGYSLGAAMGLRVGVLVGGVEGLCSAVADQEEGERLRRLRKEVRAELSIERVFAKEWWGEDGVWRYNVAVGEAEADEAEVTFQDVVAAHPLLRKWTEVLEKEARKWGVDLEALERVEVVRLET
jgi:hypothetical protein